MATSTVASDATGSTAAVASASSVSTGSDAAGQTTSIAGDDFGTCDPTIKFEGGLGGRPATEFTFQSQDPAIIAVQEEALNPSTSFQIDSDSADTCRHHHQQNLRLPHKLLRCQCCCKSNMRKRTGTDLGAGHKGHHDSSDMEPVGWVRWCLDES